VKVLRWFALVLGMTVAVFGATLAADSDNSTPDNQSAPFAPHELHEYLAENKALAFDRMRLLEAVYGQAPAAQEDMDVLYYRLDLRVDEVAHIIDGRVTIRVRSLVNGFSQPIFDFLTAMDIDSVYDGESYTTSWTHTNNFLTISLASSYDIDEEFEVTVVYHGTPSGGVLQGFFFAKHNGTPVIFTLCEPYGSRSWWPCKDRQDDKADSVDIFVEVNEAFFASSNGILRDSVDNGSTTTYWWHEQYPIATYLVSLAISDYIHFREWYTYGPADTDSMPVDFYSYPEVYEDAITYWPETVEMIQFFADTFGEYPFVEEKYGMTHFGWGGAMEHQTNTSATSDPFGFDRYLIAHELSHQWWGDYICCETWHHTWLNEGFASYCEALYAEHLYGSWALHNYMSYMEYFDWGSIYIWDTTATGGQILNLRVYDKGAWVLHMLRGIAGDQTFFDILRAYYNDPAFAHGDATTEDFQQVCEMVSGMDLDYFFQEWIYGELFPIYLSGFLQDPDSYHVLGYVTQIQDFWGYRPLFKMPIQLRFDLSGGRDTTVTIWNDQYDQTFEIEMSEPVYGISFDPDRYILKQGQQENGINLAYDNFDFDDHLGNGNGRADPGESNVELIITVDNVGPGLRDVEMQVSTAYPEITFDNTTSFFGDILHGQQADNAAEPIILSVDGGFPPTIVDFELAFSSYGGAYTKVETLSVHVGQPQFVIIDDDQADEYEEYFVHLLDSLRTPYVVWGKDSLSTPPADTLADYPFTMWFSGDSRTEVLSVADVANLRDFLDAGGRLFMTGQDIAQDLSNDADSTFLRDYLHVRYDPGYPLKLAEGVPGDMIGDGHSVPLGGPGGAANQYSPDILAPLDELAKPVYTYYNSSDVAGIHIAADGYRAVFFGFGCEGIANGLSGYTKREEVFQSVFYWLDQTGPDYIPGDLNSDEGVNPVDVVYMVNYVYLGNNLITVMNSADLNHDCAISPVDVVVLVNYVYLGFGELIPGCFE